MEWFKKIMYGRYGGDSLSGALIVLSFILLIISNVLPKALWFVVIVAYIPTAICVFRIFSKNIYKRQMENYKFLKIKNTMRNSLRRKLDKLRDLKTHKYFTCTNCKQSLRVPRGQGKISITCPKCKNTFKGKS